MMRSRNRTVIAVWLAACLALGFLGQYFLARKKPAFAYGVALYAVAVVGFILLSRWVRADLSVPASEIRWRQPGRIILVVLSLSALAWAMMLIARNPPTYWTPFGLWLGAILLFVLAFAHRPSFAGWAVWREKIRAHRWEILAVLFILLLGGLLRGIDLTHMPPNVGGDEGSQGLEGIAFLEGTKTNMFTTGWLSVPNMSFLWQALWFKLFGVSVMTLRLPWALVGTATLLVFYLLVRRLFGVRLALIATFFLCTYHYHIHFSRLGSNQVADPLFLALTLYFLTRGLSSRKPLHFALAGVVMGSAIYFYAGARLTFVVVIAYLVVLALVDGRQLRGNGGNILVLFAAAFVVVLPIGRFFLQHPDDFNARLNMVGVIQSGWLEREVAITGRSALRIMLDQFQRAFFAFNYYHDRTVWYGATIPLMEFVSAVFFLFGLGLATVRFRQSRYLPLVVWFWLGLILGGVMTESPPSSQRLITLAPSASLFVAVAIQQVADLVARLQRRPEAWRNAVVALVLVVTSVIGTRYYFHVLAPKRLYGSLNGEVATEMGYYLRELGTDYRCYFFGPGRMYYGFSTIPFIARDVEGMDVLNPISGPPDFVAPDKNAVFVFLPERLGEWQFVREKYPGGKIRDFAHAQSQSLLFTAYEVPRAVIADAAGD